MCLSGANAVIQEGIEGIQLITTQSVEYNTIFHPDAGQECVVTPCTGEFCTCVAIQLYGYLRAIWSLKVLCLEMFRDRKKVISDPGAMYDCTILQNIC